MNTKSNLEISDDMSEEQYLELISHTPSLFSKIPEELRDKKEFILKAIDVFQYDREFYLRRMSERLKDDKDIALKMVTKNFGCMEYLSARLLKDKEIAIACLKHKDSDLAYLHFDLVDELKKNGITERLSAIKYCEAFLLKEELKEELSENRSEVKKAKL